MNPDGFMLGKHGLNTTRECITGIVIDDDDIYHRFFAG
jgi:hypothetical protein